MISQNNKTTDQQNEKLAALRLRRTINFPVEKVFAAWSRPELTVRGEYIEIVPDKKIVYTWTSDFPDAEAKNTLVTVTFNSTASGTEIILDHIHFHSQQVADEHVKGWTKSLDTLQSKLTA